MKILAVDSNSILNRAYYGIRLFSNKDGIYTNAIMGFMNILQKVSKEVEPDAFAFAFDLSGPTFRHGMYDGYKASRKGMPEELAMQMPLIKELLVNLGYTIIECPGFEGDDILGTIAHRCKNSGDECVIVTGDRDCLQLVNENVSVRLASTKGGNPSVQFFDSALVEEVYGVTPKQLIDIKALQGDSSDNIPGVKGVGEKTATALIKSYGSLDYIYDHIDEIDIKDGVRKKLMADKNMAFLSRDLGEISTNAPLPDDLEVFRQNDGDPAASVALLKRLEMYTLLGRLELDESLATAQDYDKAVAENNSQVMKSALAESLDELMNFVQNADNLYMILEFENDIPLEMAVSDGESIVTADVSCLEFTNMVKYILNADKNKITYNAKQIYRYGFLNDTEVNSIVFDALLAGYILNPLARSYELSVLQDNYGSTNSSALEQKSIQDISALCSVYANMQSQIDINAQQMLLREIELPLSKILASMEIVGFDIDKDGVQKFGDKLTENIKKLEKSIYEKAGEQFNINSPKQMAEILFVKLELPSSKKTKSGYSTNVEVLEKLRNTHPIVDEILEYRQLSKLNSTYVEGLLKLIAPDGKIHTKFNQTETRTGRISSTEPNMQNIPVRTQLGREMRKFFHADGNNLLVDADYSQIELRVLAHIAEDENMSQAFIDKKDIHTSTAAQVFGVPVEMVTPKMRSDSKAVNFGIVYGISAYSLSQDIGVSVSEAKQYIEEYLNTYHGVRDYMKSTVEFGKENGYVKTIFGRRRELPELKSNNHNIKSFGERVAMNMPIQGTAADIIKIAMIKVYNRLEKEKMKSKLILQVHDELIIESPPEETEYASTILKEEMENATKLSVPLIVDVNSGKNWYEAKDN